MLLAVLTVISIDVLYSTVLFDVNSWNSGIPFVELNSCFDRQGIDKWYIKKSRWVDKPNRQYENGAYMICWTIQ